VKERKVMGLSQGSGVPCGQCRLWVGKVTKTGKAIMDATGG
jgi:hypothetical protein